MSKMRWDRANHSTRSPAQDEAYERCQNRLAEQKFRRALLVSNIPAAASRKAKSLRLTGWPRHVTKGPLTEHGLTVHTFQTPQEATAAGFGWII